MVGYSRDDLVRAPNYGVDGAIPEQQRLPDWARYRKMPSPSDPANPFGDPPRFGPGRAPPLDLRDWPAPNPLNPPVSPALPNWPHVPKRVRPFPPAGQSFYQRLPDTPALSPERAKLVNWLLALLDKNVSTSASNPDDRPTPRWNGLTPEMMVNRDSARDPRSTGSLAERGSGLQLPNSQGNSLHERGPVAQLLPDPQTLGRTIHDQPIDEWTVPPPIFLPYD